MLGTHYYTQILFVSACQFCHVFTPVIDKNDSFATPIQSNGFIQLYFSPRSPSPNLLSLPFEKDNARYRKKWKETRLRTVRRCQVVRSCLLHILFRDTVFYRRKDWISDGSKRKHFFFCKLLVCLLPCRGRKPNRRQSRRRRRRCNACRGLGPPKPLAAIQL